MLGSKSLNLGLAKVLQFLSRYQGVVKSGISLLVIGYAFFLLSENRHLMQDVVHEFGANTRVTRRRRQQREPKDEHTTPVSR